MSEQEIASIGQTFCDIIKVAGALTLAAAVICWFRWFTQGPTTPPDIHIRGNRENRHDD